MKKLTAILLTIIMLFASTAAMADEIENLNAIDALPAGVTYEETSDELALRGEFAYMVAKILKSGEIAAQNTEFSDVKEDNIYSGYIKYLAERGIVNGTNGASFNPDAVLEMDAAAKMLVCAIGLGSFAEEFGGYPDGYNYIAKRVGLYKNLSTVGGELTKYDSALMLHNALLAEVTDEFSDSKSRVLCDVLGISAYRGIITEVDMSDNSAVFNVDSNVYVQNRKSLTAGKEYKLAVDTMINASEYERIPVTVWVDENDVIMHIITEYKTDVVYGYILSINGDDLEEGAYSASAIDELMFINNEEVYSVDDELIIKYNNEYTTAPVKLCGKFAKAVVLDGRVTFIESFDIVEGGLITEKTERKIVYTSGELQGCTIRDIDLKKSVKVYVNNKSADIRDVREGTLFDFYETEDELVIVSTERVLYDKFNIYTEGKSLVLGSAICKIKGDIYTSKDGASFTKNSKITSFLGKNVKLYIAPSGYAKYMVGEDDSASPNEFYGIVSAVSIKDTGFEKSADVKLFKVEGDTVEEMILTITSKTKYDGATSVEVIDELAANAGDITNGNCVYMFKINEKGEILTISPPEYFYGTTAEGSGVITSFVSEATGRIDAGGIAIRFGNNVPMVYLTEQDGKLCVGVTNWSSLDARNGSGVAAKFFGEGKTEEPEWIFLYGDIASYTSMNKTYYGIYTGQFEALDEDGELCKRIRIISSSGVKNYDVSEEFAKSLDEQTGGAGMIEYTADRVGTKNGIVLKNVIYKLGANTDEWMTDNTDEKFKSGIVEKVAGNRVYFKDGSAYYITYYNQYNPIASVYDDSRGERFEFIELNKLENGDLVYYNLDGGMIYGMIRVE